MNPCRRGWPSLWAFALCWLWLQPAHAADPCDPPQQVWACFGSLELRSAGQTIRMSIHANQELLAEIETAQIKRRFLRVQPSGKVLYSGMSDEDFASGDKGPFMFFDYPFGNVVHALRQAFPGGPAALGANAATVDIDMDGRTVTVSVKPINATLLSFEMRSEQIGAITGQIHLQRAPALPATQAMTDWREATGQRYETLGQAR